MGFRFIGRSSDLPPDRRTGFGLQKTLSTPAGVALLGSSAGLAIGVVSGLAVSDPFKGIVIGLLAAIFVQQVSDDYRRTMLEDKIGFLVEASFDPELRPALAYAEDVTAALRQAAHDGQRFPMVKQLVGGYLNDRVWRSARDQEYPIHVDLEETFTAGAVRSVRSAVLASDPDLRWWTEKAEAQQYLENQRQLIQGDPVNGVRATTVQRVFVVDEADLESLPRTSVERALEGQIDAGVDARILVRPDTLLDYVIYDGCAVRYAVKTPQHGKAVPAVLSTRSRDVQSHSEQFNADWAQATPVRQWLEEWPSTSRSEPAGT